MHPNVPTIKQTLQQLMIIVDTKSINLNGTPKCFCLHVYVDKTTTNKQQALEHNRHQNFKRLQKSEAPAKRTQSNLPNQAPHNIPNQQLIVQPRYHHVTT